MKYYNAAKILTLKDANGNKPGVYFCLGNRTAGKSFAWKLLLIRKFLKTKAQFICLVRYKDDIENYSKAFFTDIEQIKYPEKKFSYKISGKGLYSELIIDGVVCGYVLAVNSYGKYKPISSMFVNVEWIMFDEFLDERAQYLKNEVDSVLNIHTSVARGKGEHARYVPIVFIANTVSVINPYFARLGISSGFNKNTKFRKGDGWVLEVTYNENAANAIISDPTTRALGSSAYTSYQAKNEFLLDDNSFVEKIKGQGEQLCNITFGEKTVGVWYYPDKGIISFSNKYDPNFYNSFVFANKDHDINFVLIDQHSKLIKTWLKYYQLGCVRFDDIENKQIFLDLCGLSMV